MIQNNSIYEERRKRMPELKLFGCEIIIDEIVNRYKLPLKIKQIVYAYDSTHAIDIVTRRFDTCHNIEKFFPVKDFYIKEIKTYRLDEKLAII
jgi:hypothetical protein